MINKNKANNKIIIKMNYKNAQFLNEFILKRELFSLKYFSNMKNNSACEITSFLSLLSKKAK